MNYRVTLSLAALLGAQLTGCVVDKDTGNSETTGVESGEADASAGEDESADGEGSASASSEGSSDDSGDGDGDTSGDGDGDTSGDGDGDTSGDGDGDEESQCIATGGVWDPSACDHWTCGFPNDCDAIIPGCNCGAGKNFFNDAGCIEDKSCPALLEEGEVCQRGVDQCGEGLACCYPCGVPDCEWVCTQEEGGECPPPPP